MLKVGDKLPEFEGTNQDGEIIKSSKLIGKKLVVFFYPQANTPTCTMEACNLSDNYAKLKKAGFQVLGISADTVKKTKKTSTINLHFSYDLIADENHAIIDQLEFGSRKPLSAKHIWEL